MKVFVSGATGVIGRRIVPQLAAYGHRVVAVARSAEKAALLQKQGAMPKRVDLSDAAALRRIMEGTHVVINLATSVPPSSRAFMPGAWKETARIRREVSASLVDAAIAVGAGRFIQESFAPIYREAGAEWITESSPVKPARYNRAVMDAEGAVERFSAAGRTGIVLRFGLFYGADSDYTRDMIAWCRKGWAASFGDPSGYMSLVSHSDAAGAVIAALAAPAGVYNVVDDTPVTRREHANILAAVIGAPPPRFLPRWVRFLAGSLGETLARSQRIANARLHSTGWKPKYPSVREGYAAIVKQLANPTSPGGTTSGRVPHVLHAPPVHPSPETSR